MIGKLIYTNKMEENKIHEVTFALTSCGRMDLLQQTVDSFIKFNKYPIKEWLIIEDSCDPKIWEELKLINETKWDSRFKLILNEENLGMFGSIDKLYQNVNTEYIFHSEDDWEFYRGGFIEDSIKILETQPKVIQAWIRPKSDKILNDIEKRIFTLPGGVSVRRVIPKSYQVNRKDAEPLRVIDYQGFSSNPGLKRKSDWLLAPINGNYNRLVHEHLIDMVYAKLGFMVVSLSKNDEDGYVKHIGWDNRVFGTTEATKNL